MPSSAARIRVFGAWWALTIALGIIFLGGTAMEWNKLIYHRRADHSHQSVWHDLLLACGPARYARRDRPGYAFARHDLHAAGHVEQRHAERIQVLSLYWHFVDAVWVVVFTVVYIVGR